MPRGFHLVPKRAPESVYPSRRTEIPIRLGTAVQSASMMAQTQPFGEVGYAKLGSFLTPAQLDLARHDLDGMICEGRDGTCERPNNTLTAPMERPPRLPDRRSNSRATTGRHRGARPAVDLRLHQREEPLQPALVVAPGLVVLGSPDQSPFCTSTSGSALLPERYGDEYRCLASDSWLPPS
jgi:hypothetical protein